MSLEMCRENSLKAAIYELCVVENTAHAIAVPDNADDWKKILTSAAICG
jgi:hypothetical protein